MRALSVRQPYADQIMRGTKRIKEKFGAKPLATLSSSSDTYFLRCVDECSSWHVSSHITGITNIR